MRRIGESRRGKKGRKKVEEKWDRETCRLIEKRERENGRKGRQRWNDNAVGEDADTLV